MSSAAEIERLKLERDKLNRRNEKIKKILARYAIMKGSSVSSVEDSQGKGDIVEDSELTTPKEISQTKQRKKKRRFGDDDAMPSLEEQMVIESSNNAIQSTQQFDLQSHMPEKPAFLNEEDVVVGEKQEEEEEKEEDEEEEEKEEDEEEELESTQPLELPEDTGMNRDDFRRQWGRCDNDNDNNDNNDDNQDDNNDNDNRDDNDNNDNNGDDAIKIAEDQIEDINDDNEIVDSGKLPQTEIVDEADALHHHQHNNNNHNNHLADSENTEPADFVLTRETVPVVVACSPVFEGFTEMSSQPNLEEMVAECMTAQEAARIVMQLQNFAEIDLGEGFVDCCFSPSDTKILTCTRMTVTLWQINGKDFAIVSHAENKDLGFRSVAFSNYGSSALVLGEKRMVSSNGKGVSIQINSGRTAWSSWVELDLPLEMKTWRFISTSCESQEFRTVVSRGDVASILAFEIDEEEKCAMGLVNFPLPGCLSDEKQGAKSLCSTKDRIVAAFDRHIVLWRADGSQVTNILSSTLVGACRFHSCKAIHRSNLMIVNGELADVKTDDLGLCCVRSDGIRWLRWFKVFDAQPSTNGNNNGDNDSSNNQAKNVNNRRKIIYDANMGMLIGSIEDNQVRIWSLKTGLQVGSLCCTGSGGFAAVTLHHTQNIIAVASEYGHVYVFR